MGRVGVYSGEVGARACEEHIRGVERCGDVDADKAGMSDRITHISTGGGTSLEFLGGRTLPAVAALPDQ